MKKTIAILLASMSLAMADESLILSVNNIEKSTYELNNFGSTNNSTVAISLDLENLSKDSDSLSTETPLFWLNGKYLGDQDLQTAASQGIEIYKSSSTGEITFEFCGGKGKAGENHTSYSSISTIQGMSFVWNDYQAITLVFVSTEIENNYRDMLSVYVMCMDNKGATTMYSGGNNPEWGVTNIYSIGVNSDYVSSMQVYNASFSEEEAKELAGSMMPAAPEPTTATLSLLALAGLAARRRRK